MRENKHSEPMELGASRVQQATSHVDRTLTEALGMKIPDTQGEATAKPSGHPLVSVIIPTYNRAWVLQTTIQSVFDQTYRPIECLIIDDGSTDDTPDILKQLARDCPEGVDLKYFIKENGGANSARNRGLLECKGDLICFLDSDDMLTNDSIAERALVLIEDPGVDFCYGFTSIRDEDGRETGKMDFSWPTLEEARISRYLFHTSSPLIRRSTCALVGLWRGDDLHGQEYEYFARLKYVSNKVSYIDKVLTVYVRHKNNCINDKSLSFALAIFRILLMVKALVLFGKYDNEQERCELATEFRKVAKRLFCLRDYPNACAALQESMILKCNLKVFAQWLVVKSMAVLRKCKQIVRQ